ncbi:hypothetical protein STEG23_001856 [Scotinomys teguina]
MVNSKCWPESTEVWLKGCRPAGVYETKHMNEDGLRGQTLDSLELRLTENWPTQVMGTELLTGHTAIGNDPEKTYKHITVILEQGLDLANSTMGTDRAGKIQTTKNSLLKAKSTPKSSLKLLLDAQTGPE